MQKKFTLERARSETVGVAPSSILKLTDALKRIGFTCNSMVMVKSGKVVFEIYYKPFAADSLHLLASCSKSFASTAVGFAVAEGLFTLDDRIVGLLPEKVDGAPHEFIAAMTVRHLLTMSTAFSIFKDPLTDDWTREFLNAAPDHYPGTTFTYDTSGTHTLCEVVQKFAGKTLLEYLKPRLFEPLGIDSVEWEVSPMGVNRGGGGVRLRTEDMAKFGLLYMNGGKIDGRQILPAGWAELATAAHICSISNDGTYKYGYGFQFWRIPDNGVACLGMGGQVIAMFPERDLVFAVTANGIQHNHDYFPLDMMCELVLPGVKNHPIQFDDISYNRLTGVCESAEVFIPDGAVHSLIEAGISGVFFPVSANPAGYTGFSVTFKEGGGEFALRKGGGAEDRIPFGMGTHLPGNIPWQTDVKEYQFFGKYTFVNDPNPWLRSKCGSAAIWTNDKTLVIKCHMLDLLQSFVITCHFGDQANVVHILPTGVFTYRRLPLALSHTKY